MKQLDGFRYDINGLRAIAIIAVVLFHFGVLGFAGGFVGVDVFFVLSGYLMTSIIVKALEGHRVAQQRSIAFLWKFYLSRARRIVPALLVLVLFLLALGWWILPQNEYRLLGWHSFSALSFISNHIFWSEAGYFDSASHDKWLLHSWSLSVEWQFYLLLPLIMLLAWRYKPGRPFLLMVLSLGAAASFLVSIMLSHSSPVAAFFLLPSRGWQMLAGSMVFLISYRISLRDGSARWAEGLGLAMIGLSVYLFDEASEWPGVNALLPVVGASFVILAAQQSRWARNPLVHWVGLNSYSIYLWHWPIFVALVYLELNQNIFSVIVGIFLSLLLGGLSYRLVEDPTRRWFASTSPAGTAGGLVFVVAILALPALTIYLNNGVPGRMPHRVEAAAAASLDFSPMREQCHHSGGADFPWCTIGGDEVRAVVVGDSHASAVFTAVKEAFAEDIKGGKIAGVIASSHTGCPTLFGVQRDIFRWTCPEFNEFIVQRLAEVPASVPLIIVNRSSQYAFGDQARAAQQPLVYFASSAGRSSSGFLQDFRNSLIETTCSLAESRDVYLVRPIPEMPFDVPRALARRILRSDNSDIRITLESYRHRHSFVINAQDEAARRCGVGILDVAKYLCDDKYCYGSEGGRPLYYDDDHLSEYGNRKLIPMFNSVAKAAKIENKQEAQRSRVDL